MKHAYLFLILFTALSLQACRHDTAEYQMSDEQFVTTVYPELLYQGQLNEVMINAIQDINLNQQGQKRADALKTYLQELLAAAPNYHEQIALNEEHNRMLANLRQQAGATKKEMLLALLIASDQSLIGLHVKASGPLGLKNADLRSWAEKGIAYWSQDLKALQLLKGL